MSERAERADAGVRTLRIVFVEHNEGGQDILMTFADPAPHWAVLLASSNASGRRVIPMREETYGQGEVLEVRLEGLLPAPVAVRGKELSSEGVEARAHCGASGDVPAVVVAYRGVEVVWRPDSTLVRCEPEQRDELMRAVVEFSFYERELRRIEEEIASSWGDLQRDKGLTFEVSPAELQTRAAVGERMNRVLSRRIRSVRIEPHLSTPDVRMSPAGRKLGEALREEAGIEARLETVDAQLEVFEHIYEMSSQRIGEYRASREAHVVEWIIIVLLGLETALMLFFKSATARDLVRAVLEG